MELSDIGQQVRKARRARKITQLELARRIGSQQPGVARLECGKSIPTFRFLNQIANALDVKLEVRLVVPRKQA